MNITKITIYTFAFAIVVLVVGLIGCEKAMEMIPDGDTAGKEITIGVAVSLTGKDAEPYGIPMQRGFELALEEINMANTAGAKLQFSTVDNKSSEDGAVAAVQQLVNENVSAIVGIAISDYLEDAFPIAQKAGIVAFSSVSTAAGLSSIGDYVFRAGLATDILLPNGITVTKEKLGYTEVAVIYDAEDTYSSNINEILKKELPANGVEILTAESFETGDTDFTMQLTNIMKMDPDALFVAALAPEMIQIVTQARSDAVGIPDSVHLIVSEMTKAEVQAAGDAAEGAITFISWSSAANTQGNQTFVQNYQAKYDGIEPEPWAAQSYATLYILADAIAKAESKDSDGIRDALAKTMDLPTILGNFSFDPNGEANYDPIILIVKGGELQVFE